jgi:hypothetical protein
MARTDAELRVAGHELRRHRVVNESPRRRVANTTPCLRNPLPATRNPMAQATRHELARPRCGAPPS